MANVAAQCDRVVASETVSRRQLEAVVGLFIFAGPMLCLGRFFLTLIIIWTNSVSSTSSRDLSSNCFFERGFESLQRCQVFGKTDFFLSVSPILGYFNGRLRLRLEWSDWSAQGARLLDSFGSFKEGVLFIPHKCEGDARDSVSLPVLPGCPGRQDDSNFTDSLVSLSCLRRRSSPHSSPLDKATRDLIFFCH